MSYTVNTQEKWKIVPVPKIDDERGSLTFLEEGSDCPFTVKRVFIIYNVPAGMKRGGHAHRGSWQIHFCLGGTAKILLDDGKNKQEVLLDSPDKGLLVHPLVWSEFELSSPQASLVVASSDKYDAKDYIRNYEEFKKLVS